MTSPTPSEERDGLADKHGFPEVWTVNKIVRRYEPDVPHVKQRLRTGEDWLLIREITRLRAEVAHWQRQATAAQNNATLFQQDCAFHVAEKARKDEALKPFDALLDYFRQDSPTRVKAGEFMAWEDHRIGRRELTVEMLEAARAALMPAEGRAALEQEGG